MSIRQRSRELIRESEFFLSGRYAEYLDARNGAVPDWAWLGVLAHWPLEQLRSLVREGSSRDRRQTGTTLWWQAVAFLAGELLAKCKDDRGLDELRRSALVPLELTWLAAGRSRQGPRQLVKTVLDVLDEHHDSRRR
jgi:hypothetical protein